MTGRSALRSLLFVPAARPDMVAKVGRYEADVVVVDLEDAVLSDQKDRAREMAVDGIEQLAATHPDQVVYLRVNDRRTPWFADDLAAAVQANCSGVVVPKVEEPSDLDGIDLPVIAGIETVAGVMGAERICGRRPRAVYFGAEDFVVDLGGTRTAEGHEVLYARSKVSLAARYAGIPAIDLVTLAIGDTEACAADAHQGRSLGYRGKLCVHPSQVAVANRVFAPTEAEISHARHVLAAVERGVGVVDGQMVDEVHARRARSVLAEQGADR